MSGSTDPEWLSLDVVRTELNIEQEVQTKRGDAADTRAGVILGSAGALAALALNAKTLWVFPGVLAALISAAWATRVIWPRPQNTIDPVQLRLAYVARPEIDTKKAALDRRVTDYAKNVEWVDAKYSRLKIAIGALTAAIMLVVLGIAVNLLTDTLK